MLSAGTVFAADDAAADVIAIDDIAIDEPLAAQQDVQTAGDDELGADEPSQKVYVTESNINQYISESGLIYENVTAEEFVFVGTFNNLNLSVERNITLTGGNDSYFYNPNIEIYSSNVLLQNFTIVQDKGMNSIFVGSIGNYTTNVVISNVDIAFGDDQNLAGAVPIEVIHCDDFALLDSTIFYGGKTNGEYINNVVRISNSKNVLINNNKIVADLVSVPIKWEQVGGGWEASCFSEAIAIRNSTDVIVADNNITIYGTDAIGLFDTIYVIDVSGDSAIISNNKIEANGKSYLYGIVLTGEDFIIRSNNINVTATEYVAGIDIEGPAGGVVEYNNIVVNAAGSAYGIYSGMNAIDVVANYTENNISGSAYNIFGMSLGDVRSGINDNYIDLSGNYTTGVAFAGKQITLNHNRIILLSSEEGNESLPESFGVESVGVKVLMGIATISNNTIATNGKGVYVDSDAVIFAMLDSNFINVVANIDKDAYAIYVNATSNLYILNNTVDYQGTTAGTGINNAICLYNVPTPMIVSNKFNIDLVSCYVPWITVPTDTGYTYLSYPVSEGIVIQNSDGTLFRDNFVNVTFEGVVGDYDTIYAIDFMDSDDVFISENEIFANGNSYIYGIILSGGNFTIYENNITVGAVYYADGIDVEGPASGTVENNNIDVKAGTSAYAIYSGMNQQKVTAKYIGNNITGESYSMFGLSLGDVKSEIINNSLLLNGNYTTGIAFNGSTLKVDNNLIALMSSEIGEEYVWEAFGLDTRGIFAINGDIFITNNRIATPGSGVELLGVDYVELSNNFINVVANPDKDAYAVHVEDSDSIIMNENNIDYQGTTNGTGFNFGVFIADTPTLIVSNNFTLDLVSAYVPWYEIPAGSGNYVSYPVSEGIVIINSDATVFYQNIVNVTYCDVLGSYDTIYAVDFSNASGLVVDSNTILAKGHSYIYGIRISSDDFNVLSNNISVVSDNNYANGIDIEGPAAGNISDNNMIIAGVNSAYGIYSGMNAQEVYANYTSNNLVITGYLAFGMSLGDVESNIKNSTILVLGNYTTGIAFNGSVLTVSNSVFGSSGSNVGDEVLPEAFGVETAGIKVVQGIPRINNNTVIVTSDYAIDVMNNPAWVYDNYLLATKFTGDDSVANAGNANVYNNTPVIPEDEKRAVAITFTEVDGNGTISGVITVNGTPLKDSVKYSVEGVNGTVDSDNNGVFHIDNVLNGKVDVFYDGDSYTLPANATITLKNLAPAKLGSSFNVSAGDSIKTYAVDYGAGERGANFQFQLTDSEGNPIANATVCFAYKTTYFNRTTDENGIVILGISTQIAGEYLCALSYLGDDTHNATFVPFSFNIQKKDITITASAKTFKSTAKTKKYTVTLKTQKGVDGKTYLKAGKKVTLKINGKTYTAKTNSKGQATFNLKITKKGKFTTKISFAGDKTYKSVTKSVKITIK